MVVAQRFACKLTRVQAVRHVTPEKEATPWHDPGLEPEVPKLPGGLTACPGQAPSKRLHMFAVAAVGERAGDQFGRNRARSAETCRDLKIDQRFNPIGPGRNVAAADRCGQRFGEAANTDNSRKPIEGREARRKFGLEVGKDIVFNDGEIVNSRCVQQSYAVCGDIVPPVGL